MDTGLDSGSLDDQKEERPLKPGEVCVFQGENYAGQPQVLGGEYGTIKVAMCHGLKGTR